jgi:carbonic anhydrase/acetyltransferase-like protein (isoleucine patch superfamily)
VASPPTVPAVAIYALGDQIPQIDPSAYIHPEATIIGSVVVGPQSSVWPGAVLRGDGGRIVIGARTSIQDGCVLHTTPEHPTIVGDECVVGHLVHLEGCTIEDRCLLGVGSVILHRVVIGTGATVAANAVVLNDTVVPPGAVAMGVPAKIREGASRAEDIQRGAKVYVHKSGWYREQLRRID